MPEGPLAEAVRAPACPSARVPGTDGSLKLHPLAHPAGGRRAGRRGRGRGPRAWPGAERATWSTRTRSAPGWSPRARGAAARPPVVQCGTACPRGGSRRPSHGLDRAARRAGPGQLALHRAIASRRDARRAPCAWSYSPVDLARFDPDRIDRDGGAGRLGLDADAAVLAVVAQITPWKGQDDAIRAGRRRCAERFPEVAPAARGRRQVRQRRDPLRQHGLHGASCERWSPSSGWPTRSSSPVSARTCPRCCGRSTCCWSRHGRSRSAARWSRRWPWRSRCWPPRWAARPRACATGVDGHLLPPREPARLGRACGAGCCSDPALRSGDGACRQGAGHGAVLERGAGRPAGRALPAACSALH